MKKEVEGESQPPAPPAETSRQLDADTAKTRPEDGGGGGGLALPEVPSLLADPVPSTADGGGGGPTAGQDRRSLDFENDIATRMAALKGLGAGTDTDAFGLPSAPTFQPEDRPLRTVYRRPGYTDEDQKTWCVVCLEDATVRCQGCDGDVYCARCWREMHVGPAAGFDERGHKWAKFERDHR